MRRREKNMQAANEDILLLRRYAETGDAEAFSDIVGRYQEFVYWATRPTLKTWPRSVSCGLCGGPAASDLRWGDGSTTAPPICRLMKRSGRQLDADARR